jgi:UrcA family protein
MFKPAAAACAALLAAAAAAAPAFAAPSEETLTHSVSTAGVDFQDKQAVDRFYVRLKRSASYVCDSRSADRSISRLDKECYRKALADAVRSVANPTLTARYDSDERRRSSAYATQGY